jgi:hypothetical protein
MEPKTYLFDPYGCFTFNPNCQEQSVKIYSHNCINNKKFNELINNFNSEYLFHGSNDGSLKLFSPKSNHSSTQFASLKAVFATDLIHISVLYAIIKREGLYSRINGCGYKNGIEYYYYSISHASKVLTDILIDGYIYVFDKRQFIADPEDVHHYACLNEIRPIHRIKISPKEIPYASEIWMHDLDNIVEKVKSGKKLITPNFKDRKLHWFCPERIKSAQQGKMCPTA